MSKKADKKKKKIDYKTWGYVGIAAVALIVVIVAIVNFSQSEKITSEYFKSDDKKIVLTMDKEMAALDDSEYEPWITHVVYYVDGNNITEVKAFFEYPDEETARTAFSNLGLSGFADSKRLNGRFVVFQVKKAQYEGVTVDTLKNDIELLKEINALILDYGEGYIKNYIEADATIEESEEAKSESSDSGENVSSGENASNGENTNSNESANSGENSNSGENTNSGENSEANQ